MGNSTLFLLLVIIFGLIGSTLVALRNGFSGLKLMLLGISIILCGCMLAVNSISNASGGSEYPIICIGLILSFIGLWKKD